MIIKNNTFNNYNVIIDSKKYKLNKNAQIYVEQGSDVSIKSTSKDSVHIDVLDILLGLFFGDSTLTRIETDYSFSITENYDTLVIKENNWHPTTQQTIHACYVDAPVVNEHYSMPNYENTKNRHKNIHLFVTSLLPVAIVLIILFAIFMDKYYLWLLLIAVWFLCFGGPSFREINRFKKTINPETINQKLCEYANERRNNGDNYDESTTKLGKMFGKLIGNAFDKMFKFDEEK